MFFCRWGNQDGTNWVQYEKTGVESLAHLVLRANSASVSDESSLVHGPKSKKLGEISFLENPPTSCPWQWKKSIVHQKAARDREERRVTA